MGQLSKDLLDYRIKNKISQIDFAKMSELTRMTIIKAEKGGSLTQKSKRKIRLIIGGSDDE